MDAWVETEFNGSKLGDKRLTARLMKIATARALRPSVSLPLCFENAQELDNMYNFCDNPGVTHQAILESHYNATQARIAEHPVALAIEDTTYANYTHHPATTGLGNLHDDKHQGLLLHTTLVTTPGRMPLGLINQQVIYRTPEDYGKREKRKDLPIEQKESYKWITSLEATVKLQAMCPATLIVNVGDREGDIYDVFLRAQEAKQSLLVRAAWNRAIEQEEKYLWEHMESRHAKEEMLEVSIPGSDKRKARTAQLSIRFSEIRIKPPVHRKAEKLPLIKVWAVLVREENPPPGEEAIEWLLLTTVPVNSVEDAKERVQWYSCRWTIEIYHKVLKSGCLIEERQFETAARLERYLAIDSVVAWRVLGLTLQSRETPDMSCEAFLEPEEWQALYCYINKVAAAPKEPPKLRQAARWIAQLGGFLGRKHDGEPGVTVMWRGLQRLFDIVEVWRIVHPSNPGKNC